MKFRTLSKTFTHPPHLLLSRSNILVSVISLTIQFFVGIQSYDTTQRTPHHRRNATHARVGALSAESWTLQHTCGVPAGHPRYTRAHFCREAIGGSPTHGTIVPCETHHNMVAQQSSDTTATAPTAQQHTSTCATVVQPSFTGEGSQWNPRHFAPEHHEVQCRSPQGLVRHRRVDRWDQRHSTRDESRALRGREDPLAR